MGGADSIEAKSQHEEMTAPTPPSAEQTSDIEKCTMVCRHWKSKGWCRLEENCKFLHPECKKGVSAPKGGSKGSALSGSMSGVEGSGISAAECPVDQLPPAAVGGRRRRRNRATKEQP